MNIVDNFTDILRVRAVVAVIILNLLTDGEGIPCSALSSSSLTALLCCVRALLLEVWQRPGPALRQRHPQPHGVSLWALLRGGAGQNCHRHQGENIQYRLLHQKSGQLDGEEKYKRGWC